jgi:hypothetical protein
VIFMQEGVKNPINTTVEGKPGEEMITHTYADGTTVVAAQTQSGNFSLIETVQRETMVKGSSEEETS